MLTNFTIKRISATLVSGVFLVTSVPPSHADRKRSGLDDLSKEMSTCSAYYSLLSAVVGSAQGPAAKAQVAGRIKEDRASDASPSY
jgi:hypothetical protein